MSIDNKSIGYRIRKERIKLDLSREEFAEIIGLSDYYVGQLERGERQMSLPSLVKVARCLNVSLDYLVFGTHNHNAAYVMDKDNVYNTREVDDNLSEINKVLERCSPKEKKLINKLVKTVIPYLDRN